MLPYEAGPFRFGYGVRAHAGNRAVPGAFSPTWIQVRSEEEREAVRDYSRQIAMEMMQMPGFISWLGNVIGDRMYTVTAWEDAESARRLLGEGTHREAMKRFFGSDFAAAGHTSVWSPHHLNAVWLRCPACGRMVNYDRAAGTYECGEPLPDRPVHW